MLYVSILVLGVFAVIAGYGLFCLIAARIMEKMKLDAENVAFGILMLLLFLVFTWVIGFLYDHR